MTFPRNCGQSEKLLQQHLEDWHGFEEKTLFREFKIETVRLVTGSVMYSRVMIHAFAEATGRTIEEALTDLGLAGTMKQEEADKLSAAEDNYLQELLSTGDAVKSWQHVVK